MNLRSVLLIALALLAVALLLWFFWLRPKGPDPETVAAAYATPLPPPEGSLHVFHLGHSLVGRDMPAMLAQLAEAGVGPGHKYESQLGWGTSMREHFEPDLPVNGFDVENDHPRFRPAREAVASGEYDAVVLTEMVEIRDAIRYHDSGTYLHRWADLARGASDTTRVYLYETWHHLDDPEGWLTRLDADLGRYWEAGVLYPDLALSPGRPVHVIPAGQVMAGFARALEARGGVEGMQSAEELFALRDDGSRDQIHLNDMGAYLVALTHYAVLYGRSPVGLPYELRRADGTAAQAPSAEAARLMQEAVWEVVTGYPKTWVAQ